MKCGFTYRSLYLFLIVFALFANANVFAQTTDTTAPKYPPNPPTIDERAKNWGPNDTLIVSAIYYNGELLPYKEMEMAWVSNMSQNKLSKYVQEWTRLRNAVYVTYPYARTAGFL
ncbi:MAG: hypothetical protein ABUT20_02355, partial [Bacteroidota bacterium]